MGKRMLDDRVVPVTGAGARDRARHLAPRDAARGQGSSEGWTPETAAEHAQPALAAHYFPLDRSQDVFPRDPV